MLNMVVGLVYTPYMLRMLGQSEYGLYSLAASIIAYLTVLDLGFGNAIVRYTAKFEAEGKKREQQEMFGMFFLLYIGIGRDLFFSFVLNFKMTIGEFQVSRFHEPSFLTHTYVRYKGFK